MVRLTPGVHTRTQHSGRKAPKTTKQNKTDMTQAALALAKQGWGVFPLRPGTKIPLLPRAHERGFKCNAECGQDGHGAWDGTTDEATIRRWWSKNPTAGIGANLGDDKIAFDFDYQHGAKDMPEFPPTLVHLSGRGNGNRHVIYAVQPGSLAAGIKSGTNVLMPGLDIRSGYGSYIVMPPTIHEETGDPYLVSEENAGQMHLLTDEEATAIYEAAGVSLTKKAKAAKRGLTLLQGGTSKKAANGVRMLSDLLANPPVRGTGETNDWLSRVAGHYAKQYRDKRDLYEAHVRAAANMVQGEAYPDSEIEKTMESIWGTEVAEHPERGATINNGYLTGNGRALFCQVQRREGEETVYDLAPFGDFDLIARGVAIDDTDRRMYWVRLVWGGRSMDATLDSELLGDDRRIRSWLAARGASIDPPFNAYPKTAPGVRLLRYLNNQEPTQVSILDTLGWHAGIGFVTHDGVITEDGQVSKEAAGVVADPHLTERDVAPYSYGFQGDAEEAAAVLRDVLTFQDAEASSVFGAWWAACFLRPQIQARSSLFPFFGVEATSESGKTNGYFDLMVALNGNTRGQIAPTRPVLRDYASANKNGIVWADDLDSLEVYGELLRASTSNGTSAKMDLDRSGIKNTPVVAPILITGESLGLGDQKALLDRSVSVAVKSPKERRSLKGDYPQWDDIVDLRDKYPKERGGLSVLAGWFVQHALEHEKAILRVLRESKRKISGRHGDKMAVLYAGAALLDSMVGEESPFEGKGEHSRRVDTWVRAQNAARMDKDNSLTLKLIPWALRTFGYPIAPEVGADMGRFAGIDTPVFIRKTKDHSGGEDGDSLEDSVRGLTTHEVWVSIPLLASGWARDKNHRVDDRTETETALRQQMDALVPGATSRPWTVTGTRRKIRYRQLPPEYARAVLERARG